MIFDECPPVHVDGKPVGVDVVDRSMQLSLRWAERSKRAHEGNDAALFGIVQGGVHHDLRTRSAEGLKQIGRSEEHTSELQSLMRISYAVFCLKKKMITR